MVNIEQAKDLARNGKTLMLPGWKGYFKYDYVTNDLRFENGDYKLNSEELKKFQLDKRNDWFYIT